MSARTTSHSEYRNLQTKLENDRTFVIKTNQKTLLNTWMFWVVTVTWPCREEKEMVCENFKMPVCTRPSTLTLTREPSCPHTIKSRHLSYKHISIGKREPAVRLQHFLWSSHTAAYFLLEVISPISPFFLQQKWSTHFRKVCNRLFFTSQTWPNK